mgnify:CR=1 FL=1
MSKDEAKKMKKAIKLTEKIYDALKGYDLECQITSLNIAITNIVTEICENQKEADTVIDDMANRCKLTIQAMNAGGHLNWKDRPTIN